MIAWINGGLVDASAPHIRIDDHGVTVGDGAFETMEIISGQAFALTRHLHRLDRSLASMGLPEISHDELYAASSEVLAQWMKVHGNSVRGRIRITVTGGVAPLGSDRIDSPLTVMVAAGPIGPSSPVTLWTSPWVRNLQSPLVGVKSTSYGENAVALAHAKAHGAAEAIFGNTLGDVSEGTATNLFIETEDGTLITPNLASGCLDGITRALVIEWADEIGVVVQERPISMEEYHNASMLGVTSSTRGLMPVVTRDGVDLKPGPSSQRVEESYYQFVARDLDPAPLEVS